MLQNELLQTVMGPISYPLKMLLSTASVKNGSKWVVHARLLARMGKRLA